MDTQSFVFISGGTRSCCTSVGSTLCLAQYFKLAPPPVSSLNYLRPSKGFSAMHCRFAWATHTMHHYLFLSARNTALHLAKRTNSIECVAKSCRRKEYYCLDYEPKGSILLCAESSVCLFRTQLELSVYPPLYQTGDVLLCFLCNCFV